MPPSKIIITGPAKSGKKEFLKGLSLLAENLDPKKDGGVAAAALEKVEQDRDLSNEIKGPSEVATSTVTTVNSGSIITKPLVLETKYYSAPLELVLLPSIDVSATAAATAPPSKLMLEAFRGAEALIIIADSEVMSKDADSISPFFSQMGELLDLLKGKRRVEKDGNDKNKDQKGEEEEGEGENDHIVDDSICLLFCSNKCDIASGGTVPGSEADAEENGGEGSAAKLMTSYGSSYSGRTIETISTAKSDEESTSSLSGTEDRSIAPPSGHVSYLSFARSWCADNGFEHIEICAVKPLVGLRAREKSGMPRVLEALQATMWSSMERKSSPSLLSTFGTTATRPLKSIIKGDSDNMLGMSGSTMKKKSEGGEVQDDMSSEGILESLRRQAEGGGEEEEELEAKDHGISEGRVKTKTNVEEDDGPDLGALMDEMRRIRDSAHNGSLTDEQRREAAAAMTMRLLAMMGGAEDEEEEEEEGGGDE